MERYDLVVVGGGPAGLFLALNAGGSGLKVLVLEKMPSCGRKLLITGSGQSNLTHEGDVPSFLSHYGDHGTFLRPALMNMTNRDLASFFVAHGLGTVTEKNGKIFPATRNAGDVLGVLVAGCLSGGVRIQCSETVRTVEKRPDFFEIGTSKGGYRSEYLAIATGGMSYPSTGSTGDGYRLARELGHRVEEPAPALTPLYIKNYPFSDLAGISFEGLPVGLFRAGKKIHDHTGDILFTHSGLSGPGILDLSRYVLPGDILKISFLPGITHDELDRCIVEKTGETGNRLVRTVLAEYALPERFLKKILGLCGIPDTLHCSQLAKQPRSVLVAHLTGFPFTVERLGGYGEAMVTRGGVSLREVDPKTLKSRICPNLYLTGEVLDIDGDTGGYNLQAAFSTAYLAAMHISRGSGQTRDTGGSAARDIP